MANIAVAPIASTSQQVLRPKKAKTSRTAAPNAAASRGSTVSKKARKPPLGKLLASSDKQVREDAVDHLLVFLSGKGNLEDGEKQDLDQDTEGATLKAADGDDDENAEDQWDAVKLPKAFQDEPLSVLWQGCFYCMYMCDKPFPQQKLAHQLAEPIVSVLDNPRLKSKTARRKASLAYLSIFWKTMTRELPGIDRHRMDKYYSLMRQVLHNTFVMLRKTGWNERAIGIANSFLIRPGGPMHLQDSRTPISVAYHILDIYIAELSKSVASLPEDESSAPVPILSLLEPFIEILAVVNNKAHFQRIVANVFEPLLDMIDSEAEESDRPRKRTRLEEQEGEGTEEDNAILRNQPEDLKTVILQRLFDKGAEDTTDPVNRKRLYKFAADHGLE